MKRVAMRKIREILRLSGLGLSTREIAASIGVGRTTVGECLRRALAAELSWPLPDGLTDSDLEARLYPRSPSDRTALYAVPDWARVHRELRGADVTLRLLWEEYRAAHPDSGYGYSQFCELYRRWEGRLSPTMRQRHAAGETLFVDYAGATVDVVDPKTGEVRKASIFVAALGASNLTYAEATWTQTLPDWVASHRRCFEYLGGVPATVVPDNLKAGVTKACFHDPRINRTYAEMAAHYDTALVPARPAKPRDKSKVEVAVQIVQRWVLARLRHRRFTSLADLNEAIREELDTLNAKVTRHLGASRRDLFERIDRPALKPLPATPYDYAEWRERTVSLDYHVEIDRHYYSVPHTLLKRKVWARIGERTVEIYHNGTRVAAHRRMSGNRRHTTLREHMPPAHDRMADRTPANLIASARKIGPNVAMLCEAILRDRKHPQQGYRSCLGVLNLKRLHDPATLDAACLRALEIGTRSSGSVRSILANNMHRRRPAPPPGGPAIDHPNIRGAEYFN